MPSQKQIDANRRNAAKSTGPRTPEGRAAVRLNALKHGLAAEDLLLDHEDESAFDELRDGLTAEYNPRTPTEHILLEQLVGAAWRLRRARAIEQGIFNDRLSETAAHMEETYDDPGASLRLGHVFIRDAAGPEALANLTRYEARLERSYYKALHELQRLAGQRAKQDLQKQTQLDPGPDTPSIQQVTSIAPPSASGPLLAMQQQHSPGVLQSGFQVLGPQLRVGG